MSRNRRHKKKNQRRKKKNTSNDAATDNWPQYQQEQEEVKEDIATEDLPPIILKEKKKKNLSVSRESIDQLFQACRNGRGEDLRNMIQSLRNEQLELVWEAQSKSTQEWLFKHYRGNVTLLTEAAGLGYVHIVNELLNSGFPVNARGQYNTTALMAASEQGHQEVVSMLFQQISIEPNLQTEKGTTALMFASYEGRHEVVARLVQHTSIDLNLTRNDGWTALHFASQEGHQEVASMLLRQTSIEPNLQAEHGATALMLASLQGHQEVVSILLEQTSIEPNLQAEGGFTALMLASIGGQQEIVSILLQQTSIEPNLQADNGFTALMGAAKNGHQKIVALLLQHRSIDLNLRDKFGFWYGNTALDLAKKEGHSTIVEMLQKAQLGGQQSVLIGWLSLHGMQRCFEKLNKACVWTPEEMKRLTKEDFINGIGLLSIDANQIISLLQGREWSSPENDYLLFISHFKEQAGVDARLLKTQFILHFQRAGIVIPDERFFLDSDDLHDLHVLTIQVQKSAYFLFLLTSGVFTRPWCLVELVTAMDHGCRIIPIKLEDSSVSFNFGDGPGYVRDFCQGFLSFPGKTQNDLEECLKVLDENGISTEKVQDSICHVLGLIAKPVHLSSMSQAVLSAEIGDVVNLMSV